MFNNKTTYSVIFFFIFWVNINNAQQIYIESGFENAYFKDYENNLGKNTLDLNYSKSQEVFLETGFRFKLYEDRFKWNLGVGYNRYQINTGFYAGNISIPTTYNLSYVTIKTGVNFAIVNEPRFKLQIHTHISYDFLTTGTRRYNNNTANLYTERTFDRTLLRYHRGLSAEYVISDEISTYISYNVADSFRDSNRDSNIEEKYSLHTNAYSIGLLFNIARLNKRRF
ncbi:hypothetical protein [Polaribacter sp. L3A8]|uniref:hypothetical protein n=1 Tax=Polaribacter sp. L3A8 TaxID=2686361 RepID=UPI00131AE830|nr:hypothetical protein [Polaribacter sp. L3A8]